MVCWKNCWHFSYAFAHLTNNKTEIYARKSENRQQLNKNLSSPIAEFPSIPSKTKTRLDRLNADYFLIKFT